MVDDFLLQKLVCPKCNSDLKKEAGVILCTNCRESFLSKDDKVFFSQSPKDRPKLLNLDPTNQKRWSNWRKSNYIYFKKHLEELPSSKSILDLGAGFCQFRDLTERFEKSVRVDFLPYQLIDVVADLTQKLPFKDSSFDIVLLSNVLEHIPDSKSLLRECFRVLKLEGFVMGTFPFLIRAHQRPYDFHRFTNYMSERILRESEFKKVAVENLGYPIDVYRSIQYHFFGYLFATKFSENKIMDFILKLLGKAIWQIQKLLMFIFYPIYKKVMKDEGYTQGYGFLGFKQ